jgi:exonuclease III
MVGELQPDVLCLQEIKVDEGAIPEIELPSTAVFSKAQPKNKNCKTYLDPLTEKHEGRVILVEYEAFIW